MHGGLSPGLSIDELRTLDRLGEIPCQGVVADILWSDPDDNVSGFSVSPRGAGWLFGGDVTREFCRENNVSLIVRAHQLVMEGYRVMFGGLLCTVWSAPNYCYRFFTREASLRSRQKCRRSCFIIIVFLILIDLGICRS